VYPEGRCGRVGWACVVTEVSREYISAQFLVLRRLSCITGRLGGKGLTLSASSGGIPV
jgi:hypothetical protein